MNKDDSINVSSDAASQAGTLNGDSATASAIRYCGALPVFVDIDPATFNTV